jgi:hypothetical protein
VDVARRLAENMAEALRRLDSMAIFRGHEADFDMGARAMSEARVLELSLVCAERMTDPDAQEDVPDALPTHVRALKVVEAYNREVRARDQRLQTVFLALLERTRVPNYELEHICAPSKKTEAGCFC